MGCCLDIVKLALYRTSEHAVLGWKPQPLLLAVLFSLCNGTNALDPTMSDPEMKEW